MLKSARLYYQPQVTTDGRQFVGVEALLRVINDDGTVSGPQSILDKVQDDINGAALDWWALETACRDAAAWPTLSVAINITARQFKQEYFADRVIAAIARWGTDPKRVELEILEHGVIEDFESAIATMNKLRAAGIRIALDDFGTGYSSLAYLQRLPIDKLKIDKSLIDGVPDLRSAAIVQAITALSRALGIKVVAEGVETTQQKDFLRVAGCHMLQGYLLSPAVPPEEIAAMVAAGWPGVLLQPTAAA